MRLTEQDHRELEGHIERWYTRSVAYFRRRVGNPDLAEDLAHDAWARALDDYHNYDRTHAFSTWFFPKMRSVYHHYVRDDIRHRQLVTMTSSDSPEFGVEKRTEYGVDNIDARLQEMSLVAELGALPPREKTVLYLITIQGLSQDDAAEIMGISQMHVSRILKRARERLSDILKT